jgi:transcriptional regulator with XRE-family HTH domain
MYGAKIRSIREMRGLSQGNIAAQIGVTQNSFSKIETDQSKLESRMLLKIADALEVSPIEIVSDQLTVSNSNSRKLIKLSLENAETIFILQRDFFEKAIAAKDAEIANLNKIINSWVSHMILEHG